MLSFYEEIEELSCQHLWLEGRTETSTSASVGTILATVFPPYYMAGSSCKIEIKGPPNLFIRFKILRMVLREQLPDQECYDNLVVTDIHEGGDKHVRGIYSGNITGLEVFCHTNHVTIDLQMGCLSANMPLRLGFEATYSSVDCTNNFCEDGCGDSQYFTSPNGQISSLGFPSRLPPFSRCFWTIQAPENMFIALTFDEFNVSVGLGHNKQCMDTVFIDEPHLNKSLAFCGQAPPFFISTSNRVVIRYETSLSVPSYGFQTTYNMTDREGCWVGYRSCSLPYECYSDSGAITSPNFPHGYPTLSFCTWQIVTSPRTFIEIEFFIFSIPSGQACRHDYVSISGLSALSEVKFCDAHPPTGILRSAKNSLQIVFTSSQMKIDEGGFYAVFKAKRFLQNAAYDMQNESFANGLTDRLGEGHFRWVDGRPMTYTDWFLDSEVTANRQPDDGMLGDCSVINLKDYSLTANWHDIPCASPRTNQFICKKPAAGYTACPPNWFRAGSQCLFLSRGSWSNTDSSPEVSGSHVIVTLQIHVIDFLLQNVWRAPVTELYTSNRILYSYEDEARCEAFRFHNMAWKNEWHYCNTTFDGVVYIIDAEDFCYSGFQCYSGRCIPSRSVCDGYFDCPGKFNEDESPLCDSDNICSSDQLQCLNGVCADINDICIYSFDKYDLQKGCRDVSHLRVCEYFDCPTSTFKCPNSYCIPVNMRCDHQWDCPNGEDEIDCDKYKCPGNYRCHQSTSCVSFHQICNGIKECPEGDDEYFCDRVDKATFIVLARWKA
ncbi:Zinc metalloproteinase nas-39 [Holothuria leucospilota]|uniref:Zinc metalloproteinase nas-39 n=1 Tax=Holothuria leucospilota TaxID=206669 RepID=A0A9Q1CK50_HOLLE|nr:Zinc metalloproteinase nas-39 [Holothuria leucospilota]